MAAAVRMSGVRVSIFKRFAFSLASYMFAVVAPAAVRVG